MKNVAGEKRFTVTGYPIHVPEPRISLTEPIMVMAIVNPLPSKGIENGKYRSIFLCEHFCSGENDTIYDYQGNVYAQLLVKLGQYTASNI